MSNNSKNNNTTLNKVFSSVYKDEIEKRLAIGQSPRAISKWLETRGENISYATINTYKKEYFDVNRMMGSIVKEAQEEVTKNIEVLPPLESNKPNPINQGIAQIRAINHVALLYNNIQDMQEYLAKLQNYEPVVAAHAAKGIWQEIRATIETLEKIQANSKEDDNSSVAKLISNLRKKQREMNNLIQEKESKEEE